LYEKRWWNWLLVWPSQFFHFHRGEKKKCFWHFYYRVFNERQKKRVLKNWRIFLTNDSARSWYSIIYSTFKTKKIEVFKRFERKLFSFHKLMLWAWKLKQCGFRSSRTEEIEIFSWYTLCWQSCRNFLEVCISIVMIDSISRSFCLRHYVQNGLSYLGQETQPKLCLKRCQANPGVRSLGTNKHQFLHRITSIETPLTYNKTCGHHRQETFP